MKSPLRIAVIGVGHLGRYHAQKYASLEGCELIGVVDQDPTQAAKVAAEVGCKPLETLQEALNLVDAVSIATPTQTHHNVGMACLDAGRHVLMEKPLAASLEEGRVLVERAESSGLVLQVGYLERFNPAYAACQNRIGQPQFIEAIRIAPFVERGADVDVVLDLMSHDLDLVLAMAGAPLSDLHAVGISLRTDSTDLANTRLVFDNGCVANLTASRISGKAERRMRIFQKDRYFSIDFGKPAAREFATGAPAPGGGVPIIEAPLQVAPGDALLSEISSFLAAVQQGSPPLVSGKDGLQVMTVAARIIKNIAENRLP